MSSNQFPMWLKATCCIAPLAALIAACVFGVNSLGLFGLTVLCWRVVSAVLGIRPVPLVLIGNEQGLLSEE